MCLDWLFNAQIPDSTDTVHIVRPSAKTFVTGIATAYDENSYDHEKISPYLSQREYVDVIERINDTLLSYFPCPLAWYCGYLCSLFTLGLSLLCPLICVRDAEENVRTYLRRVNKKLLKNKNMEVRLVKKCGTSWLEWQLPPKPEGSPQRMSYNADNDSVANRISKDSKSLGQGSVGQAGSLKGSLVL